MGEKDNVCVWCCVEITQKNKRYTPSRSCVAACCLCGLMRRKPLKWKGILPGQQADQGQATSHVSPMRAFRQAWRPLCTSGMLGGPMMYEYLAQADLDWYISQGHDLYRVQGFPHKGWDWDSSDDHREPRVRCQVNPDHPELRYVHTIRHPDARLVIRVGCQCCGDLTGEKQATLHRKARVAKRMKDRGDMSSQKGQEWPHD
jgi:hypothetical protein